MGKQVLVDEDLLTQNTNLLNQQAIFIENSKKEMLQIMGKLSERQEQLIKTGEELILYKEAFIIFYQVLDEISINEIGSGSKAKEALDRYRDLKALSMSTFEDQNN